ncbi:MAG: hypothetical protein KJN90_10600 [Gammaproteobacteria bacterium]|nr:hypothetical protein [Gammaproteobacteria bacterium]MBT8438690.1 hypothetical protein [Gammaproteobacteria bacterium]
MLSLLKGDIDVNADTIVAILVTTTHTPSVTADSTYANITNICADADYTASFTNGLVITGMDFTSPSSRNFRLDAPAMDFGNAVTISARYLYVLKRVGGTFTGTDPVLGYMDLNDGGSTNVSSTNGDFDVDWNDPNGLFTLALTP